ncbi:hypothetical protein [Leyella stercorea]|uniref:hypothetical protein n=1 Tax=Leyella stercorea TaxID=363265 RepID=UPI003AF9BE37
MRKVIKTVMMAAFTAIAMSASAASVQTYSASSDSVLTQPVDTLSEKLAQMENRVKPLRRSRTTLRFGSARNTGSSVSPSLTLSAQTAML